MRQPPSCDLGEETGVPEEREPAGLCSRSLAGRRGLGGEVMPDKGLEGHV